MSWSISIHQSIQPSSTVCIHPSIQPHSTSSSVLHKEGGREQARAHATAKVESAKTASYTKREGGRKQQQCLSQEGGRKQSSKAVSFTKRREGGSNHIKLQNDQDNTNKNAGLFRLKWPWQNLAL